ATPLAIVWSVQEVHPMWVLIIRYFGASLLALAILAAMRNPLPFDRTSMMSYVAGSLNLIGAQLFIYLAANYLTSGLMALIFGLSPLIAGLIGHVILKTHKLVWLQWLGMVVAVSNATGDCLERAGSAPDVGADHSLFRRFSAGVGD
ncbi:EamA family transporter, partial [Staphylococcus aureus]|uniref:EamA family transporter n=1 Tax=Staphylococcus aureus TaxID=1280 RepID=UPI001C83DCCD